jgi:hypothetical protein
VSVFRGCVDSNFKDGISLWGLGRCVFVLDWRNATLSHSIGKVAGFDFGLYWWGLLFND